VVQASATLVLLTAAGLLAGVLRLLAGLLAAALLMLTGLILAALLLVALVLVALVLTAALLARIVLIVLVHHVLSPVALPHKEEDCEAKVPITSVSTLPTWVQFATGARKRSEGTVTVS
jgi:hypothetical protein